MANISWAFSTLNLMDDEFLDAIADEASRRLSQYSAKELAVTAWSMATLLVADDEKLDFLDALAMHSIQLIHEFSPQDLSQTSWAFAKLSLWHKTLLDSLAAQSLSRIQDFEPINLRNMAWSFATLAMRNTKLMTAISEQVLSKISEFYNQQHLANTAWAFAKLHVPDMPLLDALSSAAIPIITEFAPQGLSNISWAYARLNLEARPLMEALASEALKRLSEIEVQNLANTAWSFATLGFTHQPFIEAIASAALRTCDLPEGGGWAGPNVQSMLWNTWKMERGDLTQAIYERWSGDGRLPCVLELGLLAMESAWGKDARREPELQVRLMRAVPVRLMRTALWKITPVPEDMQLSEAPALPPCDSLGLTEQECRRYLKLARFVQYLECTGRGGSPEDVIEAVECFPKDIGRWLKVAGGDKAIVLWDGLRGRPNAAHEIAVEFGALVGYTTIRLGAVCARLPRAHPARAQCVDVATCELDAVHVCVARHSIDLAGLSGTVEVWMGQVRDLVPRFVDEFGCRSLGFVFMDQRGTAFHDDLQHLELIGALGVRGRVIADNCLKPGAPFFVWHVSGSGTYSTTVWTMGEFASEEIEDWMVVSDYMGMPDGRPVSPPPHVHKMLSQLAWETDNARAGSTSGNMRVDDWVAFSQYVLRYFRLLGIEATPWEGLPEPEGGYRWDMPLDNAKLAERVGGTEAAESGDLEADA